MVIDPLAMGQRIVWLLWETLSFSGFKVRQNNRCVLMCQSVFLVFMLVASLTYAPDLFWAIS